MSYKSIEVLLKPYEGTVTTAKPSTVTSRPTTTTRTSGTYTKPSTSTASTTNTTRTSGTYTKPSTTTRTTTTSGTYTKPSTTTSPSTTTTRTSGTYTKPAASTHSTTTTSGTYTKPSTSTTSTTRRTTTDRYSEVTENGTPLRRPVSKTSTPSAPARTYSTSSNDSYSSTTTTTSTSRPASSSTYSSPASTTNTSYTSPASTSRPSTIGGKKMAFAVQVAAYGKAKSGLSAYSKLKSMGTVYEYDSGRLYKVRVGYFADRTAAETALSQIKSKGYKDAFIVSEAVAASSTFVTPSTSTTSYTKPVETKTYTKPAQTTAYTQPATSTSAYETASTEVYGNYKVRLAAYSDAKNFDDSQVRNLGTIEHWRKKGWTIVVLSGFESLSSAQAAKSKVASYGFKDAYIVIDDNGVLKKVK
jgi:cell division protein FtsN